MVMKKIFFLFASLTVAALSWSQGYPQPEFSNEVYYLKKENSYSLVRLEKNSAKQQIKTSMIKGSEYSYEIEGKSSPIRFGNGNNVSFIYSTAASSGTSNAKSDSMLRANGMDPNTFNGLGGDPSSMITLYKLNIDGGSRKIYLQKTGGYFGNHKNQSSDKYTFSLKKIHDGYWELVIDKSLPKGEYAFSMTGMGGQDINGSHTVFAFGID
jgi:hypothetical protein